MNWLQFVELLLLTLLLGFGSYELMTNRKFEVRQIQIDGIRTVNGHRVAAAAAVPPRTNIFLYLIRQRAAVCRRVAECDPAISNVSIGVELPDALRLQITERQPSAVLHVTGAQSYVIDVNRIAYRVVERKGSNLPTINVTTPERPIVLGRPLPAGTDGEVLAAGNLMQTIAETDDALGDYRAITVDAFDNVSVVLNDGLVIKLGQPDGLADRLALAHTALAADPSLALRAEYLNFTSNRPAYMPKQTTAAASLPPVKRHPDLSKH